VDNPLFPAPPLHPSRVTGGAAVRRSAAELADGELTDAIRWASARARTVVPLLFRWRMDDLAHAVLAECAQHVDAAAAATRRGWPVLCTSFGPPPDPANVPTVPLFRPPAAPPVVRIRNPFTGTISVVVAGRASRKVPNP
jgi:hypothetical protein